MIVIDILNQTAKHMMKTASKIMIVNSGMEHEKLWELLYETPRDIKNRANKVAEQQYESDQKAKLEIQSLNNRIILYKETITIEIDVSRELTKEHIQKKETMSQIISKLEKTLAKTETEN